jgi:hypothetical protein
VVHRLVPPRLSRSPAASCLDVIVAIASRRIKQFCGNGWSRLFHVDLSTTCRSDIRASVPFNDRPTPQQFRSNIARSN